MKTVVAWIGPLAADGAYPARLFFEPPDAADWRAGTPDAEGRIARALADPESNPAAAQARRTLDGGSSGPWKPTGEFLHGLLAAGGLAGKLDELRVRHAGNLRLVLDIEDAGLALLPWELLYRQHVNYALAMPVLRGRRGFAAQCRADPWPLRVLVVVGCKEEDERILAEKEVAAVTLALRTLRIAVYPEVLRRPDRLSLAHTLQWFRPHVVHFIGHGREEAGPDGGTRVYLEAYQNGSKDGSVQAGYWDWGLDEIVTDLVPWQPRFVFLNACRSAVAGPGAQARDVAWAIRDAFLASGVPAVLGMQGDVRGDVAVSYARNFYGALAADEPPDRALGTARRKVAQEFSQEPACDWALASLTMTTDPDGALSLHPPRDPQEREEVAGWLDAPGDFVNRRLERRAMWEHLMDFLSPRQGKFVLVVHGEELVGKTSFVRTCLGGCALCGQRIALVNGEKRQRSFVDVLRLVRKVVGDLSPLGPPAAARPFEEFDRVLDAALDDGAPVPPAPGVGIPRRGEDRRQWPGGERGLAEGVLASFCAALGAAASASAPLCLVLDHVKVDGDEFREFLLGGLVGRIAGRKVENVRLILIVGSEGDKYGLETLKASTGSIRLADFPAAEFQPLALEYMRCQPGVNIEQAAKLIECMDVQDPWKPTGFQTVLAALRMCKKQPFP